MHRELGGGINLVFLCYGYLFFIVPFILKKTLFEIIFFTLCPSAFLVVEQVAHKLSDIQLTTD